MADYDFYAGFLRFVAGKTECETPEIEAMMSELLRIADQVEAGSDISVKGKNLKITARALAGVAGFLQQHILPEIAAAGNKTGEDQIRWVIDNSMEMMATMLTRAELSDDDENLILALAPPPEV